MTSIIGSVLVVSAFIVTGILCAFFPRAIQKYALRSCERWPPVFKWYPPRKHIESGLYVWELRLIGTVALVVGVYFLLDLLKRS
jgi:uncharacterized protein YjeT (DUF2065 family)